MSARDVVLGSIRRSLGVAQSGAPRSFTTAQRLAEHPRGVIPERGGRPRKERIALFRGMLEAAHGSVEEVATKEGVPAAITAYLRSKNLPMKVRRGSDPRFDDVPWDAEKTLEVSQGSSDGSDLASVSYAFAGVAETGTLVLHSGGDNPTTLNFLPEHHFVVLDAADIVGDYETVLDRLRTRFGAGRMPRVMNWITGPSRSADIEQVHLHGAHGPRSLHVLLVSKS